MDLRTRATVSRPSRSSATIARANSGYESESRLRNGLRARAEAAPTWHKHGVRRSVAGSFIERSSLGYGTIVR